MMENIGQTKEKHETNETKHRTGDMISRSAAIEGLDGHYVERATLNDWQEGWNAALDWVRENYLEELPSAQPEQRWIPVTERLPEKGQKCLVSDRGRITIDVFLGRGGVYNWQFYLRDYEAWMPLPEPYTEEKKK